MRTSPTLPSPLLFQNNHITILGNITPLFTIQPCKYMEFSNVVLSDYTSLPEQFAVFPSGVHCPFVDLHSWPCHYFFPNCTKEPPNLSEYDFINEQPSQGLPQCHFPTGESLSGTFCPIPICCTAVGLGPSFTAHVGFPSPSPSPFLSARPSLLPSPLCPLHCRGARLLAVLRQREHKACFLKTSLFYFPM